MKFDQLKLKPFITKNLKDAGFDKVFEVQEKAIPIALEGEDVLVQSKTGSGKTLAFVIPAINQIEHSLKEVQVLILTPTRELAQQVNKEIDKLIIKSNVKTTVIYGGVSLENQARICLLGSYELLLFWCIVSFSIWVSRGISTEIVSTSFTKSFSLKTSLEKASIISTYPSESY